jgi:hypothetical protein
MQQSTTEAIQQIQEIYHQQYAPDSYFNALDQLLICETLTESSPILPKYNHNNEEYRIMDNTSVNGSVNDGCKLKVNAALFESKQSAIEQLQKCTYRASPIEIADLLNAIFSDYQSFPGHWLYIAQHWNPRAINRVIQTISKLHSSGQTTIRNPSALFTFLIKKRKPRKSFMNAIDGCKQHTI